MTQSDPERAHTMTIVARTSDSILFVQKGEDRMGKDVVAARLCPAPARWTRPMSGYRRQDLARDTGVRRIAPLRQAFQPKGRRTSCAGVTPKSW
jgi:hypothetical protein